MTIRDVEEVKIDINNKKIDALINFITYKKKVEKEENAEKTDKSKSVIDYYNQEICEFKNINFTKRNS